MIVKKNLIDELKKYNSDLEKHFSKLDFDFDSLNDMATSSGTSENQEFFSLLASNLMDVKTELSLVRRNLSVEMEGILKKVIFEQQTQFMNQMNSFYGKIILEVKENLSNHVKELNQEISDVRKDFIDISVKNSDFTRTLDNFSMQIFELKSTLSSFNSDSTNSSDLKNFNSEILENFDVLNKRVSILIEEISKKNNYIESNLLNLNKKLVKIENFNFKRGEGVNSNETEFNKNLPEKDKSPDEINKNFKSSNIYKGSNKDKKIKTNFFGNGLSKNIQLKSSVGKILAIDDKLEKLESLRD